MGKEYVVLVDEHDNEIGKEEKLKAHKFGLLHRAFSVFLFRKRGDDIQLLLQQRAKHKYHCGGLWANTCCSHPRAGEDIIEAGKRRLRQEMGIEIDQLKPVCSFKYKAAFANGLTEHEIDHVLVGTFDADQIDFNPDEVEAAKWISVDELNRQMAENPDMFVPWLKLAYALIPFTEIV